MLLKAYEKQKHECEKKKCLRTYGDTELCRLGYPYKEFDEEGFDKKECMYQRRKGEERISPYNLELLKIFKVNHHI